MIPFQKINSAYLVQTFSFSASLMYDGWNWYALPSQCPKFDILWHAEPQQGLASCCAKGKRIVFVACGQRILIFREHRHCLPLSELQYSHGWECGTLRECPLHPLVAYMAMSGGSQGWTFCKSNDMDQRLKNSIPPCFRDIAAQGKERNLRRTRIICFIPPFASVLISKAFTPFFIYGSSHFISLLHVVTVMRLQKLRINLFPLQGRWA